MPDVVASERGDSAAAAVRETRSDDRAARLVVFVAAGWALLLVAWVFGNPPFAAPDEPAHYVRAIAVGGGHVGGQNPVTAPPGLWGTWTHPEGVTCNVARPRTSAACTVSVMPSDEPVEVPTTAGAYPPLYYALPGLALRLADDPATADRAARAVAAVTCLGFLVLALALLASPRDPRLSVLGPILAVSPMVLFTAASVNSSGLEVAAGVAFFAALVRIAREPEPPAWIWGSAAAAGLVLVLVRSTGVAWLVAAMLIALLFVGPRSALGLARTAGRRAVLTACALLAGVIANRAWEQRYGSELTQEGGIGSGPSIVDSLVPAIKELPRVLHELVGVFGWLDTPLPTVAYRLWETLVLGLVAAALLGASRRSAGALAAAIAFAIAAVVFLSATLRSATGMDVQGRHVLPLVVVVPLLAGEILFREGRRFASIEREHVFWLVAVGAALLHLLAWYTSARRQAVALHGPLVFPTVAEWTPPLGWIPWFACAAAGSALLALAPLATSGLRRKPRR